MSFTRLEQGTTTITSLSNKITFFFSESLLFFKRGKPLYFKLDEEYVRNDITIKLCRL